MNIKQLCEILIGSPLSGALNIGADTYKISRFATSNLLYLANNTRQHHSYCGRWTGNCNQVFEWYQFQWPWV